MKKITLLFAALLSLALCSCVSSKAPAPDAQGIGVGGLLQTNDRNSYFIILGRETKSAQTFFFVKDAKNSDAWKTLVSSVGKTVFVRGKVAQDSSPWLKTVAVTGVEFPEP